jgi:hypothetical protein
MGGTPVAKVNPSERSSTAEPGPVLATGTRCIPLPSIHPFLLLFRDIGSVVRPQSEIRLPTQQRHPWSMDAIPVIDTTPAETTLRLHYALDPRYGVRAKRTSSPHRAGAPPPGPAPWTSRSSEKLTSDRKAPGPRARRRASGRSRSGGIRAVTRGISRSWALLPDGNRREPCTQP